MIADLLRRMTEGLLAPRASARRVLLARYGVDVALLFAVLAYAVQAMLQIVIPGARTLPEGMSGIPVGMHFVNLLLQVLIIWILSMAVFGIGRLFGGQGSRSQAFVLVAWHALVTTLLAPLFLLGAAQIQGGEIPAGALFVLFVAGSIYLWVLACFTAELHGFRSPWGVMGVMLAVMFLFSGLFMNLAPAP